MPKKKKTTNALRAKQRKRRPTSDQAFYTSTYWRKIRHHFRKLNPLCVECYRKGEVIEATVTDHIIPMSMGGSKDDFRNLQSLCRKCHDSKSQMEQRGICPEWKLNGQGEKIPANS